MAIIITNERACTWSKIGLLRRTRVDWFRQRELASAPKVGVHRALVCMHQKHACVYEAYNDDYDWARHNNRGKTVCHTSA